MSQLKVLVVGASVAGPTTAYWLAKAGAKVTVIERFPTLRTSGQNIDVRTVGVTVMRRMMGMEAAVRAKLAPLDGLSLVRNDGRSCGIIRATGNPDQQSLLSEYEIFRGDLSRILFDLTKDNENIKYVFGEQIVSMQQNEKGDGPVKVEFANGLSTSEYDLVVACDGATSRTRAIGFGYGIRDYVEPVNIWAAYFSIKKDILQGSRIGKGFSVPGGLFMSLKMDPSGVNRVMLMGVHPRNESDIIGQFREATKQGDSGIKQFIAKRYSGVGWKADEVMEEMMQTNDLYASELVQVKTPSLHRGRFVLVGDAGYAPGPTGGGTSLAMAGGYLLAGEICKHRGNLSAGLEGYETQMRPIITELQKIPPIMSTAMAPQTAWGVWLRNQIWALLAWTRVLEFAQRFLAGAFANNDETKLPEYDWVR